ncbi:hypothetical protein DFJ58DRAFT_724236 [Suillus subalutaceus]|uniref:uncharacterized protein n=1 Tax=Suillus subalutaceus TaxID=48586 RepID=UPI001B87E81A|nr:uncharacterized protein DFJ58DRAFT_724236 [Suillus subalutaceus]KAG1865843.1 hypothetical protein DFJ58DRAFT_724236 [Suillus subalutaceus]
MHQPAVTVSGDKLDTFGDYIGTGSQVERWFKALTSIDKATWSTFVTAFEKHWPPVMIAEKTKAEYERELLDHALREGDVGKKTMLYDRECWTHIAWAVKALQLATNAGIDQGTSMIWQVRSKLPDVVKDLLKDEEYKAWADFMKAQQHPPAKTHRTHVVRQPATSQQQFIITEDVKTIVRQFVNAIPQQPDSPSGKAAYANQLAQWNAKWGESKRVTHEMGYPLKPGTAAISSGECFGCRTHGHNGRNCPLPGDHAERLSCKEAAWRAITSKVLGAFNRNLTTPISLVVNHTPQYNAAWIEELKEQDEGKAEGSA